jgi:hypothetical protein
MTASVPLQVPTLTSTWCSAGHQATKVIGPTSSHGIWAHLRSVRARHVEPTVGQPQFPGQPHQPSLFLLTLESGSGLQSCSQHARTDPEAPATQGHSSDCLKFTDVVLGSSAAMDLHYDFGRETVSSRGSGESSNPTGRSKAPATEHRRCSINPYYSSGEMKQNVHFWKIFIKN